MAYWPLVAMLAALVGPPQNGQGSQGAPFDVTRAALARVDSTRLSWSRVRTFVGGVEGAMVYRRGEDEPTPAECRAVALLGLVRLRNLYRREWNEAPVVLRMDYRCGPRYSGELRYDGVNVRLKLRDRVDDQVIYRGRIQGLP